MLKFYEIILAFSILVGALFFWLKHEKTAAKNEIIIERQGEIIKETKGTVETKNNQQKLISQPDLSDDLTFRDDWLQLLWREADAVN